VPEGRVARAGHPERSTPAETLRSAAPDPIAGTTSAGTRRSTRSPVGEEDARRDVRRDTDDRGRTVNRCDGIAFTGGCTDTNEFNYLVVKTMRSLGVCYLENQARV
jgi:hypothetical protein